MRDPHRLLAVRQRKDISLHRFFCFVVKLVRIVIGVRARIGVRIGVGVRVVSMVLVLGVLGAAVASRWMASLLHGISPWDATSWAVSIPVVALAGLLAAVLGKA